MIIVCTGGRDFADLVLVHNVLGGLNPSFVYVGDCPTGVDNFVRKWCEQRKNSNNGLVVDFDFAVFDADWDGLGRPAGPIRNAKMCAAAAKAGCNILIAFPGNKGTNDCVRHGKSHRMNILRVEA